jgi:hypothetical protein
MRNLLMLGTTGLILVFGAAGANANGPNYSPYEILTPQAQDPQAAVLPLIERRSAFTNDRTNDRADPSSPDVNQPLFQGRDWR